MSCLSISPPETVTSSFFSVLNIGAKHVYHTIFKRMIYTVYQNLIYVFPEMKLPGLVPNSYKHVSVDDSQDRSANLAAAK
jgi:hypothetical protein